MCPGPCCVSGLCPPIYNLIYTCNGNNNTWSTVYTDTEMMTWLCPLTGGIFCSQCHLADYSRCEEQPPAAEPCFDPGNGILETCAIIRIFRNSTGKWMKVFIRLFVYSSLLILSVRSHDDEANTKERLTTAIDLSWSTHAHGLNDTLRTPSFISSLHAAVGLKP